MEMDANATGKTAIYDPRRMNREGELLYQHLVNRRRLSWLLASVRLLVINHYIIFVNHIIKTKQPIDIIISKTRQVEQGDKNGFLWTWSAAPVICMILFAKNKHPWIHLWFGGST